MIATLREPSLALLVSLHHLGRLQEIAVRGFLMKYRLVLAFSALALAAACNPTPHQQRQLECGIGTVGGAALGAAAGNAFGGGSGRTIMTAAGGAAGAMGCLSVACR